ncbi:armadillo repeat-containing protein 5, partial [Rhincodon typus]|uniref:armadillo repeat-containing protein 5 n=1 Tax=Rhincodon typus TaxID=259920 RepID=UPI002030C995
PPFIGAVSPLIGLLTLTEEADCLQTALRTLRILSDTPCHRRALTAQGLVPPLVAVMSREEPGLLGAACRAAAELTRCCGAPCALQLSRHGGIPRLASLAGHEQRAVREGALSTLGNLCVQGFVRPSVGGAGGVGLLLGALRSDPTSPAAPAHLRALCLCCREAVNRARVREDGGLDLLVSLLKEPGHRASHPRVLGALLAFFYDQVAIDYLHARGLVPVLLAQLLRLSGVRPGALATHPLPQDGREAASFDYPLERPIQGEEQPAEASSSFLSLRSWLLTEGYIESPDELLLPGPCGESEIPPWLAPEREEAEGGAADRPGEASSCSRSEAEAWLPETPVLLLLSRFSQAEDPAPSLLTEHSVRVFLDYLSQAPAPSARCSRILVRLVCNPNCLEALLRARAVPLLRAQLIHGWRPPSVSETAGDSGANWTRTRGNKELGKGGVLRNLSVQAESPFGAGAVTHLLLSGSRSDRERCGIALPLLCRNETLRRKLLLDHGGLHLLLETLLGSEDPVTTFGAADGLAWILGSGSPDAEPPPLPSPRAAPCCPYGELSASATDLRLLLDGGERLAARRSALCRGSEVFAAMLGEGGPPRYLEWSQREVKIQGLAQDVGEVLVHHLHGCQAEGGCPVLAPLLPLLLPPEGDGPELETSLLGRSLAASAQFLLSDLRCHLQELAARSLRALLAHQLPAACLFAERHSLPGLQSACLRQLLLRQPPPLAPGLRAPLEAPG